MELIFDSPVKGKNIPEPGVPESFKVLIKELQSLALDIKVMSEDKQEIVIREIDEDETELGIEAEELATSALSLGAMTDDMDIPDLDDLDDFEVDDVPDLEDINLDDDDFDA